ncbi:MAG TPA: xanthine dehydrogenase family protein subunit M [Caulobacteraceae bacterium]
MTQVDYLAPTTPEDAARALLDGGPAARPLAGGTDLLVQLRSGRLAKGLIVDLKRLPGAIGVRREGGGFVVGAATPGIALGEDEAFCRAWPGVAEAAQLIGSTQVQGRASIGGNLCNASPAADSVPALVAARAVCVVVGPSGRREVPAEAVAKAPGETTLEPGEFVLEFRFPPRPTRASDAYLRSIPRTEMDIAVVGAGVSLALDGAGVIVDARIALGAVAPVVVTPEAAAQAIVGSTLDEAALERLDAAARAACRPISDKRGTVEYRTRIAGVLARRAAAIAYQRAKA